ncbi:MAG: hypothetical protein Q7T11_08655 [Deltaproteobacteria bacterium]|nr:hypothetical protein [Deltaproteobacteria bacterium]
MKKALFFFLLLFPLVTHAKIYILIEEASAKKFPIAVPQFLNSSGKTSPETESITKLVRDDLKIAGIFKILDESVFTAPDHDVETIDFAKWTAIDAFALLKGIVDKRGGRLVLEMRLYDTRTKELLAGKQYTVEKKDYPAAVHRFMDETMLALTGTKGPFSSRIAAACGKQNGRQIHSVAIDGTFKSQVTKIKANNISPTWSPSGSQIAFTSFIRYYPEVFIVGANGGGLKQLTNFRATTITPSFSPSGDAIAFASSRSGDTELYVMTPGGSLTSRLTAIVNIDLSPAWSPDGGQIVFASERAGNLHLFSMPKSGGSGVRLTYTGYQNDQPDWSPDGKRIVFTARDRGAFDVFMMNADGTMIQRLTRDEGNNESPTWSPDSRYVSFSRGNSGIFVMLDDGNNQTGIPGTAGCINPEWGPWVK